MVAPRWHDLRWIPILVCLWLVIAPLSSAANPSSTDNGAVILMYHRFGESLYPATSVGLEQFEQHLAVLEEGPYSVLPLPEIIAALRTGDPLPDRAVAITIDDAFLSFYREAWPRLTAADMPFTIFVATGPLNGELPDYMTWEQLRQVLAYEGATLGAHSVDHGHMLEQTEGHNRAEILDAQRQFRETLGIVPTLFAYPFGEYNLALRDLVAELEFAAAFSQQSGAAGRVSDRFALPRFPINEAYAEIERFELVINSLPLPATDITPTDPQLTEHDNPPAFGFTLVEALPRVGEMQCYSDGTVLPLDQLGDLRFEVRPVEPFRPGRNRINCTMPGPDGRWRWLGRQFYLPPS